MNGANYCASQCIDPVGFNGNINGHKEGWLGHLSICMVSVLCFSVHWWSE